MFQFINSSVCVEADWLTDSIVTKATYENMLRRNKIIRVQRGGNGRKALIDFDTLPERLKQKVVQLVGNPYQTVKQNAFKDSLINDLEAVKYFNNYTLKSGDSLPQKNIAEYVANAVILNGVKKMLLDYQTKAKALGTKNAGKWERIAELIQDLPQHTYPHSLPANHRRLKEKFQQYHLNGYESLIHRGFCNNNSEKINDDAKLWVLSRWADQFDKCATTRQLFNEYNKIAESKGWKKLQSDQTLFNYLNQEDVKHLWWGHRYGELKAKEKFSYQHSTILPTMRDSLWYSDGTKLNYYFLDENGKISTCQVYEVMDAFSEVLLGYHISPTENFQAQYGAYKMAVKVGGFRPYQIAYDNQGGHKKLEAGNFLTNLAKLSISTQPYNGKSKTIESAFGRFQNEYLKRDWFFTGQNITAKKLEGKANHELILANKENLPTLEEIKVIYAQRRTEWNEGIHSKTGKRRIDMYFESHNPESKEVTLWEMVELFWIQHPQPITFTASGLDFQVNKAKYQYMVHDVEGLPNQEFLETNIDKKFIVKYDPDDMSTIHCFEQTPNGLRFVTLMTPKVLIHRGKQEQEDGEMEFYKRTQAKIDESRIKRRDKIEEVLEKFGATAAQKGLNAPAIKGLESSRKKKDTFGKHIKEETNLVPLYRNDGSDEVKQLSKII
jgi:hypothetical protein